MRIMQSLRLARMAPMGAWNSGNFNLKNKLVGKNAVTGARSSRTLRVMGFCRSTAGLTHRRTIFEWQNKPCNVYHLTSGCLIYQFYILLFLRVFLFLTISWFCFSFLQRELFTTILVFGATRKPSTL